MHKYLKAEKKMPRKKSEIQDLILPPVSTPEEVKRTVERRSIHRGKILIEMADSLKFDKILEIINSFPFEKDFIHKRINELNIDKTSITRLDESNPPVKYAFYFCTPEYLMEHPGLVMYYRNMAMLSRKVMRGIGLPTDAYEDKNISPSPEIAIELTKYFNGIISKLVMVAKITPNRHLEIILASKSYVI
jgi:hypothetical protein